MPNTASIEVIYELAEIVELGDAENPKVIGRFLTLENAEDAIKVYTKGYENLTWFGPHSVLTPRSNVYIIKQGIDDYTYKNWE